MKRFFLLVALVCLSLTGCASNPETLQRETARVIGDISPEQVQVSNVKRGATNVSWDANTPKGAYGCSADDMVRRPMCNKK